MANRINLYQWTKRLPSFSRNHSSSTVFSQAFRPICYRQCPCVSSVATKFPGSVEVIRRYVHTIDDAELQKEIDSLTIKMNRLGRLNIVDIKNSIEQMEEHSSKLNNDQFLKLLQLTLKMVETENRNCGDVVQQVWNLFVSRTEGNLTLEHMEIYFQMCLLAEVPIDSKTMLGLIRNNNVKLNRDVLEVMILINARNGRPDHVAALLSFMEEKNIPIDEVGYTALILAYGFKNDLEGVESILDTMESNEIPHTTITYHALMTAYAVSGNFYKLKEVVDRMKDARVACTPGQHTTLLLDLIKSKQVGENYTNMYYILNLAINDGKVIDLSKIALHLIHRGFLTETVKLLSRYPPVIKNKEFYNNAIICIQEMVRSIQDPIGVISICRQLEQEEINKFALLVALEISLKERRDNIIWPLLKALKNDGKPLRPHYFWPLFSDSENIATSKLMDHVSSMIALDIPPDLDTLSNMIIPGLPLSDPQSIEQMLKNTGLKVSQIATPLMISLLNNNMVDKALDYAKTAKVQLSLKDLSFPLARAWHLHPQSVVLLLSLLIQKSKKNKSVNLEKDWGCQFLLDITSLRNGLNKHQIAPLFKELAKNDIKISEESAHQLFRSANISIQEELRDNIDILVDSALVVKSKFLPHPNEMNLDELENHLVELKAKGFRKRGTIRRLVILHAGQNNNERVLSLIKELEDSEETLSPGILSSLLSTYISSKNFTAAYEIYLKLTSEHPSFLDLYKKIDLSAGLLGIDEIKALQVLEESIPFNDKGFEKKHASRRNCSELLMAAARTRNYDTTKKIFDLLLNRNIIKIDNVMLGFLIRCHLNTGDLSAAVKEAKRIEKSFKFLPMKMEILINLLHDVNKAKDNDDLKHYESATRLLEDMVEVISTSQGSQSAQEDLFFACVEAGYPSEAAKIIRTFRRVNDGRFRWQCQRYAKTMREDPLLHLLTACKPVPIVPLQNIYEALLQIYNVENDAKKGMSLWIQMQDDDAKPSLKFIKTLTTLLESNKMELPFKASQYK